MSNSDLTPLSAVWTWNEKETRQSLAWILIVLEGVTPSLNHSENDSRITMPRRQRVISPCCHLLKLTRTKSESDCQTGAWGSSLASHSRPAESSLVKSTLSHCLQSCPKHNCLRPASCFLYKSLAVAPSAKMILTCTKAPSSKGLDWCLWCDKTILTETYTADCCSNSSSSTQ